MGGPTREWVGFDDPKEDGRRWQVDVTFLLSSWQCIFGCGCQGVLTERAPEMIQGCCSYGAHFSDKKDRDHVVRTSKLLSSDDWEFAEVGWKKGIFAKCGKDEDGKQEWRTRLVDDACIFLNRDRLPERPRMCAAPVRDEARPPPQRSQTRGVLATPPPAHRRGAGGRHGGVDPHRVRARRMGRGRRRFRVVVHRGSGGVQREANRCTGA